MKSGNIQLLDLDFEYKLWKNRIVFYQAELTIINARIDIISKEFEDFMLGHEEEKLLSIQLESLKSADNKISTMENEMALYAEDYPISETHIHYLNHESMRSEMKKIILRHVELAEAIVPMLCYPMINMEPFE